MNIYLSSRNLNSVQIFGVIIMYFQLVTWFYCLVKNLDKNLSDFISQICLGLFLISPN